MTRPQQNKTEILNNINSLQDATTWIDLFNETVQNGSLSVQDFLSAFDGSNSLRNYLSSLKEGTATLKGYTTSLNLSKASTIALKIATASLEVALTMGLSIAIQAVFEGINYLIHYSDNLIEKGNEAIEIANNLAGEANKNTTSLQTFIGKYEQLIKSSNNFNKNVENLSSTEYQDFLSISNELSKVFPELVKGYDSNGNAILTLDGNIKSIITSLEELIKKEQTLANIEIVKNMPDAISGTYEENKKVQNEIDKLNKEKGELEAKRAELMPSVVTQDEQSGNYKLQISFPNNGDSSKKISFTDILEKFKIDYNAEIFNTHDDMAGTITNSKFSFEISPEKRKQLEDHVEELINYKENLNRINQDIDFYQNQIAKNSSELSPFTSAWLETDFNYADFSEPVKEISQVMVEGLDFKKLKLDNQTIFEDYVNDNILKPLHKLPPEVKTAFSKISDMESQLQEGKIGEDDFKNDAKETLTSFFDGIDSNNRKNFENLFIDSFNKAGIEGTQLTDVIDGLVQKWSIVNSQPPIFPWDYSETISQLDSYGNKFDSLQDLYNTFTGKNGSLEFSDFSSLNDTFKDMEGISTYLEKLQEAGDNTVKFKEIINEMYDAMLNAPDGILSNVTNENFELVSSFLQSKGILNAEEIVMAKLGDTTETYAFKKKIAAESIDQFSQQLMVETVQFLKTADATDITKQSLAQLALAKMGVNKVHINAAADIDNILAIANTANASAIAIAKLEAAKNILSSKSDGSVAWFHQFENAQATIKAIENGTFDYGYKPLTAADFNIQLPSTQVDYDYLDTLNKQSNALSNSAQKASDTAKNSILDAAEEAKKALDELIEKFDELEKGHDLRLSLFTDRDDKIQDAIKLLESQGNQVGKAFYEELINSQNKQIQILTQKRSDLESYLNDSVSSGKIDVGTEQWFKMTQAVEDTKDEIMKCTLNVEDFQNKINELHWKQFDNFIDRLDGLDSEISNIQDILSKKDLVEEDTGEWTKEGITTLALYGQAYELAIFEAQQYSDEIKKLEGAYKRGEYSSTEYQEKLQDLTDKQWESIKAAEKAKEGIIDLNKARVDAAKKGIEKEIKATEELIDKKKEALDIEKESHDFQNSVAEKQDEIYKLQRQLNGLATDDSQEAAAKKKKIQAQLTDTQKELDEIYYDESIDQQKAALDTELENYKADQENKITLLEESLTNEEELIKTSLQTVQDNHTAVYDTLTQMGNDYGIQLSNAIVSPWTNSSNALANFSTSFDEKKSHFTTELGNLGKDFEELGKKADETAQKILNMLNQIDQTYTSADSSASEGSSSSSGSGGSSSGGSSTSSKPSPQKSKDWRRCQIVTSLGELMGTFSSTEDAKDWLSRHNAKDGKGYHIVYYARGTRHASSGLALVNEQGTEAIFSRTPTGSFHLMNEGDQVFTKQQTDNLYRLSTAAPSLLLSTMASPALPGIGASNQQQTNSPTNIDIKCPVYIQGSVDNQNIQKIQKQIDHSILKAVGKLNQSLYKSGARRG